jgi:arylsulfatase A-like enzyme
MDGQHRFPEKMPAFESSLRVPLLIRMPGQTTKKTISRLVLNTDVAPTLAQLAQVTPTITVDGRSLIPLMINPQITWRTMGLVEHSVGAPSTGFGYPPSYLALRTDGAWPRTFVRYPSVTSGVNGELYDLATDPDQLQNLYVDPARQGEVGRLNLYLSFIRTCRGTGCAVWENSFTFQ